MELGREARRIMAEFCCPLFHSPPRTGLVGYGLEIVDNVELVVKCNIHNEDYLATKKDRMGHDINM